MPRGLEVITGFVTAPSTTQTALTMATGNSNIVRSFDRGQAWLLQAWNMNQTAGILRAFSPRMHDAVNGIRLQAGAANPLPLLPYIPTPLVSQDNLTLDLSGSATAGDIEQASFLILYTDLNGVDGRFIDTPTLRDRLDSIMAVQNTISTGTAGGYSGEEAINADFDNFKANAEYAILGYVVRSGAAACTIRYRGADFGNLGVGGPGNAVHNTVTANWFVNLSDKFQTPLIPVWNSSNKAGMFIDAAVDENGADPIVSTIMAKLK